MKIIIFEGMDAEQLKLIREALRNDGFILMNKRPEVIELIDTERIKLGDMDIERPVELISKEDMPQTASSKILKKKGFKPITKKKPKTKKVRNSQIPRKQVKWTDEIIDRIKQVANEMTNSEIRDLLSSEFGINVSVPSVANAMFKRGIKRSKIKDKPKPKPVEKLVEIETPEMKRKEELAAQKRKGMSKEVVELIRDKYMEMTDEELREEIGDKFGAFFQVDKIEAYRESNGMARPEGWDPDDFKDTEEET